MNVTGKQALCPRRGDAVSEESIWSPDVEAPIFEPRPRRDAATAANVRIQPQADTSESS